MLPEFEFWRPRTVAEALAMLAEHGPELLPIAGGTNVVPDLRGAKHHPKALMDLSGLDGLRGIYRNNGQQVVVGAGTTISDLLASPVIAETAPALREAARTFANPLVRNRATVGGNLADASPAADSAPPLLALGAEVELSSLDGTRCVPLEDFLVGVRRTLRRPNELLTAIRWQTPASIGYHASAFYKVGLRKSDAISVLSAAVSVECDEAGRCMQARIALGAVAPTPLRAHEAEEMLCGHALTPEAIAEAAHLAAGSTRPIDDIRGSASYRRQVAETITRRLLAQTAQVVSRQAGGIA